MKLRLNLLERFVFCLHTVLLAREIIMLCTLHIQSSTLCVQAWTWSDVMADYEAGESYRQEVSWADRCDSPPEMLSDIPRSPGRALHLHQRLSSPSRRRCECLDQTFISGPNLLFSEISWCFFRIRPISLTCVRNVQFRSSLFQN